MSSAGIRCTPDSMCESGLSLEPTDSAHWLLKEKKRRKLIGDFISFSVCVSLCNFNDLKLYITK